MVTKAIIIQYNSLLKERDELIQRIDKLENQIDKILEDGAVIDKVMGGEGGLQAFKIEGFPYPEYSKKKLWLNKNRAILQRREEQISKTLNEVEEFISSIDDSHIRRIVTFRIVEGLSWNEVADKIGGGNTNESVKKTYYRFMDSK